MLATELVADSARIDGVSVLDLGSAGHKNVAEPVEIYELTLTPARVETIDPAA